MILYPEKIPLLEMDLIGWYWNSVEQYQPVLVDYFTLFCTRMEQYRKGYGGGGGSRTRVLLSFHQGIYKLSRNICVFSGHVGNRPPQSGTPP